MAEIKIHLTLVGADEALAKLQRIKAEADALRDTLAPFCGVEVGEVGEREPDPAEERTAPPRVVDLMAALEQSLAAAKAKRQAGA